MIKEIYNSNSNRVTARNERIHFPLTNPFPIIRTIANSSVERDDARKRTEKNTSQKERGGDEKWDERERKEKQRKLGLKFIISSSIQLIPFHGQRSPLARILPKIRKVEAG